MHRMSKPVAHWRLKLSAAQCDWYGTKDYQEPEAYHNHAEDTAKDTFSSRFASIGSTSTDEGNVGAAEPGTIEQSRCDAGHVEVALYGLQCTDRVLETPVDSPTSR
ncbi:hypothetical protein L915_10852 [Phytophthora nicotianae]|uniref:Uncharacterized protein n=1 Tax=Phytophthora nicotianae TaxID=4792 RepID=W2GPE4_PHYNI|nr:hypothetical protein L915_10852 [Phytophthora nicotianae]